MPTQAEVQAARRKSTAKKKKAPARRKATAKPARRKKPPVWWPSLGAVVCDWIETYCVHGPGDVRGQPVTLTDEERRFIWRAYEVHPKGSPREGRRRWPRAAYVRRKGVRKTELAGWITEAELVGPVRFAGWDANGQPVGRPVTSPYIPVSATTLEQNEDTLWGAIYASTTEGPLVDEYALDVTLDGIVELHTGGEMKPVTSSSISRDGGKPSFTPRDELHLWYRPDLRLLNDTLLRNLRKRPLAEPWTLGATTAWAPKQNSAAESEALEVLAGAQILWDMRSASEHWNLDDDDELRQAIIEASGDALPWTDVDGIVEEFRRGSRAAGKRYWLSIPAAVTEDESWLRSHPSAYEDCREPGLDALDPDGAPASVGIDSALRADSVAIRALQRRSDGTVASIAKTWISDDGRTYDRAGMRNWLRALAAAVPLKGVGYDPRYLESEAQDLADEGLPMIEVPQSPERMVPACLAAYELLVDRLLRHDDDEPTGDQITAAVPRETDGGWRLSKGKSGRKIDSAVALAIAAYVAEHVDDEPEAYAMAIYT